jgi:hypothetical protein
VTKARAPLIADGLTGALPAELPGPYWVRGGTRTRDLRCPPARGAHSAVYIREAA